MIRIGAYVSFSFAIIESTIFIGLFIIMPILGLRNHPWILMGLLIIFCIPTTIAALHLIWKDYQYWKNRE